MRVKKITDIPETGYWVVFVEVESRLEMHCFADTRSRDRFVADHYARQSPIRIGRVFPSRIMATIKIVDTPVPASPDEDTQVIPRV